MYESVGSKYYQSMALFNENMKKINKLTYMLGLLVEQQEEELEVGQEVAYNLDETKINKYK